MKWKYTQKIWISVPFKVPFYLEEKKSQCNKKWRRSFFLHTSSRYKGGAKEGDLLQHHHGFSKSGGQSQTLQ